MEEETCVTHDNLRSTITSAKVVTFSSEKTMDDDADCDLGRPTPPVAIHRAYLRRRDGSSYNSSGTFFTSSYASIRTEYLGAENFLSRLSLHGQDGRISTSSQGTAQGSRSSAVGIVHGSQKKPDGNEKEEPQAEIEHADRLQVSLAGDPRPSPAAPSSPFASRGEDDRDNRVKLPTVRESEEGGRGSPPMERTSPKVQTTMATEGAIKSSRRISFDEQENGNQQPRPQPRIRRNSTRVHSMKKYYETATAKSNHSSYFSLSSSERLADGLLSWGHSTDLDARTLSFKDGDLEDAYRERYYNGAKKSAVALGLLYGVSFFVGMLAVYLWWTIPLPRKIAMGESLVSGDSESFLLHALPSHSAFIASSFMIAIAIAVVAFLFLSRSPTFRYRFQLILSVYILVIWTVCHCFLYYLSLGMLSLLRRQNLTDSDVSSSILALFFQEDHIIAESAQERFPNLTLTVYSHMAENVILSFQSLCLMLCLAVVAYLYGASRIRFLGAVLLNLLLFLEANTFFLVLEGHLRKEPNGVGAGQMNFRPLFVFDAVFMLSSVLLSSGLRAMELGSRAEFVRFKYESWKVEHEAERKAVEAYRENMQRTRWLLTVAHELRTPVHSILGSAELLVEQASAFAPDDLQHVDIIKDCSEKLVTLVDNVHDLAKMDTEVTRLNEETIDILKFVDEIVQKHGVEASQRGLKLQPCVDCCVPLRLKIDRERLEKVIRTLLSSSILYGTRNCITLLCSLEAMKEDAVRLRFTIEDEGETIPKHELATLFQRFSRKSGQSQERTRMGARLGLTLCAELCRVLGGEISAKSDEGVTAFSFTAMAQFVAQETIGDRLKAEQVKLENDHESVSKGGAILFLSPDARFRRAMRCLTKPWKHLYIGSDDVDHAMELVEKGHQSDKKTKASFALDSENGETISHFIRERFSIVTDSDECAASRAAAPPPDSSDASCGSPASATASPTWKGVLSTSVAVRRAIKQRVSVYNGEEKMKRKASKRMTNRLGLRAIFIDDASPINIQMLVDHLRNHPRLSTVRVFVLSCVTEVDAMKTAMAKIGVNVLPAPLSPVSFAAALFGSTVQWNKYDYDNGFKTVVSFPLSGGHLVHRSLSAVTEGSASAPDELAESDCSRRPEGTSERGKNNQPPRRTSEQATERAVANLLNASSSEEFDVVISTSGENPKRAFEEALQGPSNSFITMGKSLKRGKSFEENNVPSPAPSVVASDMCVSQDSAPTEKLPSASGDIASCIDSRMVVLLVDDEKLPRTVGSRLVRSLGWQCVTAMSGMDALQKLETSLADSEQHIFDVILMDYQMPEMNGIQTTVEIRGRDWQYSSVPIVAATANGNRDECLAAGMNGFIPKPFRREMIAEAIRAALHSQTAEESDVSL